MDKLFILYFIEGKINSLILVFCILILLIYKNKKCVYYIIILF